MENVSSEQELLELLKDGKINEDEYKQLLEAMRKSLSTGSREPADVRRKYLWRICLIIAVIVIIVAILLLMITVVRKQQNVDLAIAENGFNIHPHPDGEFYFVVVSILNQGETVSPQFPVNFYHGSAGQVEPKTHRAGPIEPGDVWKESTLPFALKEGVNDVFVVLDPYNKVIESDETNNSATLRAVVKNGQIISK